MSSRSSGGTTDLGPMPMDLTHHFSKASKKRVPNVLKEYYKFLRVPDMGNLAGGLPFTGSFPFNSVELSTVGPESLSEPKQENDLSGPAHGSSLRVHIPRSSAGPSSVRKITLDTALQYGSAKGYPPLYAWLLKLTNSVYHPNIPYRGGADIMINGGSADGLSKIYELLFNSWDEDLNDVRDREGLIVDEFVYSPPITQIRHRGVNIVPIMTDSQGMLAYGVGGLSDVLQNWDSARGKRPHALYLIPTGQNPTSGVLSFQRRLDIYQICSRFDLILIEDDPYWNLYYPSAESKYHGMRSDNLFRDDPIHSYITQSLGGQSTGFPFLDELIPSFLSIDTDGRVIRLDSFSKTIAPGCRLGWITAQPSICEQLFRITDGTTQQPSGFTQAIVAQLLGDFENTNPATVTAAETPTGWGLAGWVRWLEGLRSTYERRMVKMATVFEDNRFVTFETNQKEMFNFSWPKGGMFIWIQICISNHPLFSSVDPKRLMFALWILCTQHPYRVLTNPGGDFAANEAIKEEKGYLFLRFCFAAVEEDLLEVKSRSFVEACRKFWTISDAKDIDFVLHEEDKLNAKKQAFSDVGELDREIMEVW